MKRISVLLLLRILLLGRCAQGSLMPPSFYPPDNPPQTDPQRYWVRRHMQKQPEHSVPAALGKLLFSPNWQAVPQLR